MLYRPILSFSFIGPGDDCSLCSVIIKYFIAIDSRSSLKLVLTYHEKHK